MVRVVQGGIEFGKNYGSLLSLPGVIYVAIQQHRNNVNRIAQIEA
jgi:hypothetical protein